MSAESLGVIYARYSFSGQREESIEGQLRDCREYAKRHGIRIVGEYCDRALTGTNDRRPEFQRMIRDSARGHFSFVLTWKNDRFARSRYDSAIYKHRLKQNGVRVLYAKETIPDGPEGIILESMMEGFAEYYSANLSQNVKRGNYDSALKRQTLGQTLLGYRCGADKRFEIDPKTAPIVRRIFEEYAAGAPAREIYGKLNDEGYRTSRGNLYNKNSIRRIISNEKYVGVYRYMDIVDENGIPPIVSRELFDKANRMLQQHHRAPAAKKTDGGFLLTGKIYCGLCGDSMHGDSGTSHSGRIYSYYSCSGRRRKRSCEMPPLTKQLLEDAIVDALVRIVHSDEMIEAIADRFMTWQEAQRGVDQTAELRARLRKVDSSIRNVVSLLDDGLASDSLKTHLIELEQQRAALEASIAEAEASGPEIDRETLVWYLTRFREGEISSQEWRIQLVETFLRAAYVYPDGRLLLHLNYAGDDSTVSLQLAEQVVSSGEVLCSDIAPSGVPDGAKPNTTLFFMQGIIVAAAIANTKKAEA